jgi:hypothetical protein
MWMQMKMPMLAMFNFSNTRKVTGLAHQHVQNPQVKDQRMWKQRSEKKLTLAEYAKTKISEGSIRGSNSLAPTQSIWSKGKQLQNLQVKGQRMQCPRLKNSSTRKIHRFRNQQSHNPQAQKFNT